MYEVYIMNRPVIFQENPPTSNNALIIREPEKSSLNGLPNLIRQNPDIQSVVLLSEDPEWLWMQFCYGYKEILAAGCVVKNNEGAYLWIERNGKWDLAKGKVESGESIEEAAVREVQEETGIGQLRLKHDLGKTYHTYDDAGTPVLKTTFWFHAEHAGGATKGTPQAIEGITGVHWEKPPFASVIRANAYPSILALMERIEPPEA